MKHLLSHLTIFSIVILMILAGCAIPPSSITTSVPTTAAHSPAAVQLTTAPANQSTAPAGASSAADPNSTQTNVAASPASGSLQFAIVANQSTVDYKVREQLASLNLPSDAIGKTNAITGSIAIKPDGTIDSTASKFVVDVFSLASDKGMRDNFLRRNTLQSSQFPQVTFVPTQVTGLASPFPQSGNFTFQLTGDMTVRDVTKPVTWDITGQIQNGQITAHATTTITFENFNLSQPRVPVVLSVEDKIVLEADLVLQKQ